MLAQILNDMFIEPQLLAELDEEQKQLLFCKMREEQVRRWKIREESLPEPTEKRVKTGGKRVSFLIDDHGEPIVVLLGENDEEVQTVLEEKAKRQAELETDDIRKAAEEELDKLVNYSRSTVQTIDTSISRNEKKLDPTREAVVKSLQEATLEMEKEMKALEIQDSKQKPPISPKPNVTLLLNKPRITVPEKPKVAILELPSDVSSQNNSNQSIKTNDAQISSPKLSPEIKLTDVSQNLQTASRTSLVTVRPMTNGLVDFPTKENGRINCPLKVATHIEQYEKLSDSSLEALKTATLERAKKRRQKEIFEHLRQQVDAARLQIVEKDEIAWLEQEKKAKEAEKKIRDIARRAREVHRRTSLDPSEPVSNSGDINGNEILNAKNVRQLKTSNKKAAPDRPQKPPSRQSIIEWYRNEEFAKGAGLSVDRKSIAAWFHGLISRQEAESLLSPCDPGTFLVRISERIWGYAVSYRAEGKYRHYLIDEDCGKYSFLGSYQTTHKSLGSLIEYHKSEPIASTGQEILKKPCPLGAKWKDYRQELFQTAIPYEAS